MASRLGLDREKMEAERRFSEEASRIARQRNLFTFLPVVPATQSLKQGMLDRARELFLEGRSEEGDAILEFVPSRDAEALLNELFEDDIA